MKKELREKVYNKFNGHCAYCGKEIEYKDMQVDHLKPKFHNWSDWEIERNNNARINLLGAGFKTKVKHITRGTDDFDNLMPSCRRCNGRKSSLTIEDFRQQIRLDLNSLKKYNPKYRLICDFGLMEETNKLVTFYFEESHNE